MADELIKGIWISIWSQEISSILKLFESIAQSSRPHFRRRDKTDNIAPVDIARNFGTEFPPSIIDYAVNAGTNKISHCLRTASAETDASRFFTDSQSTYPTVIHRDRRG